MPSIIASYKDVTGYFTKSNFNIPESLEGIWNLSTLNNIHLIMQNLMKIKDN